MASQLDNASTRASTTKTWHWRHLLDGSRGKRPDRQTDSGLLHYTNCYRHSQHNKWTDLYRQSVPLSYLANTIKQWYYVNLCENIYQHNKQQFGNIGCRVVHRSARTAALQLVSSTLFHGDYTGCGIFGNISARTEKKFNEILHAFCVFTCAK